MLNNPKWNNGNEHWRVALRSGANLLRKGRLVKGRQRDGKDGYCFHGALNQGYVDNYYLKSSYIMATSAAAAALSMMDVDWENFVDPASYGYGLASWNNKLDTTKEQVIDLMEMAADLPIETVRFMVPADLKEKVFADAI
jgi:hypothetical protein